MHAPCQYILTCVTTTIGSKGHKASACSFVPIQLLSRHPHSGYGLNEGAAKVAESVQRNKLTLNVKKTQLLLPGRRRREAELNQVEVWLEEQVLPRSSCVRCLGVWIDDKLSWKDHISRVHQKCFGALLMGLSCFNKNNRT